MPNPAKDLNGQSFGYLTVLRRHGTDRNRATWWCRCICGRELVRISQVLRDERRPQPKSCGRQHGKWNVIHGATNTRLFKVWQGMISANKATRTKAIRANAKYIRACAEFGESLRRCGFSVQVAEQEPFAVGLEDAPAESLR